MREKEKETEKWKEKVYPTEIFPSWLDNWIIIVNQATSLWGSTQLRIRKFFSCYQTYFYSVVYKFSFNADLCHYLHDNSCGMSFNWKNCHCTIFSLQGTFSKREWCTKPENGLILIWWEISPTSPIFPNLFDHNVGRSTRTSWGWGWFLIHSYNGRHPCTMNVR